MEPLEDGALVCGRCGKDVSYAAPSHHISPGGILNGKYLIGAALGEGGFGITYIGRDLNLDMKVAVKEYFPNGYVNRNNELSNKLNESSTLERKEFFDNGLERFLKEARILARFSGEPGIVDVHDFFEENNTAYIVMEYLDGKTLKQFLKENGKLDYEETMRLLSPVMMSLMEIHKQGLIHRDISPDNIMIIRGKAKLLDFGAARNISATANKSLSVMLKPGYAPEEQYRSKGNQGSWTDVYAISATIYKCITGVTPDDAAQRVFTDEVKTPSGLGINVPSYFEKALMKGMAVFQRDRYATVDELIAGLNSRNDPDSENEDDKKTVYLTKDPSVNSEDDIPTRYLDSSADSENEMKTPPFSPAPAIPEFVPRGQLAPEPMPVSEFVPRRQTAPKLIKPDYIPEPVPAVPVKKAKKKSSLKAKIICAIISGFVLLVTAAAVIIPNMQRSAVSDTSSVSFINKTLTAEDTAKIADNHNMKYLYFYNCVFEDGAEKELEKVENRLSSFIMQSCTGFSDLSFLSALNPSYRLEISNCGLTDSVLDTVQLQESPSCLILKDNPELSSLKMLERLPELSMQELDISNTAVSDISQLERCTKLSTLRADNCGIKEISALGKMPANKFIGAGYLSLYLNNNEISDLTPIRNCKIDRLEISDNKISTLKPLSECEMLNRVCADRNLLTSLNGLENSLSLEYLSACENKITELSGITNCTILKWVDLSQNNISDISLLSKSRKTLERLYLNGNQLDDIHVLDNFKALQYLNIDDTSVPGLPKGCTGLIGISAQNNKILTAFELKNCRDLEYVYLADNNILLAEDFNSYNLKVCDLSGNGFNYVSAFNSGDLAAIYNNPIGKDISVPEEYPEISEKAKNNRNTGIVLTAEKLLLSYDDTTDFSGLKGRGVKHFAFVDCPKDKQLPLKSELSSSDCTVSFITAEAARKELISRRIFLDGFSSQ